MPDTKHPSRGTPQDTEAVRDLHDIEARLGAIEARIAGIAAALFAGATVHSPGPVAARGPAASPASPDPIPALAPEPAPEPASRGQNVLAALREMTVKQHATLQMLLAGARNADIARKFQVSENTAKVHVRTLMLRLSAENRTQVAAKVWPVLEAMSDDAYRAMTRGLPKDWYRRWGHVVGDDDPCWPLYTSARHAERLAEGGT